MYGLFGKVAMKNNSLCKNKTKQTHNVTVQLEASTYSIQLQTVDAKTHDCSTFIFEHTNYNLQGTPYQAAGKPLLVRCLSLYKVSSAEVYTPEKDEKKPL